MRKSLGSKWKELSDDHIDEYFEREVLPHVPDAWIDHDKTKVGYESPLNRHFYVFEPPRELAEIDAASSMTQPKTCLEGGDVLTVRVGAPGVTAVVPPECEGGNCASVMLMRKGDYNPDWLCYTMNTRVVRYQVEIVQYGAAQKQFHIAHAVNFWVPFPSRKEQDATS